MTVKLILERKGYDVFSTSPETSLADAVTLLARHKIGAVVVCDEGHAVRGILSERDVVRAIAANGADALWKPISEIMTVKVSVCDESHTINQVMETMTRGRFRHMPVEKDGRLHGIVSIGDVVKLRIEEVERESEEIRTYIATA
ncbi:CBS domain-containing protein [Phyllobacterium sp. 21LDTY02-6]|jgi:CBS domain-containing protein|uniref:CBS domain-containing protein n=1 Tax=unclassified Phyllobacterium TaxID=2638441 RepID=UPI0020215EAB|nr:MULTISPECIES: CBS domain-containing protein [unclassified Phyllobacterium]MCO4316671.1 CBS domain-containing protein [Phyllobacterium sp. 21LDTY02-6]MCX8281757.1 CBS domain-containing protein [Phyllobacterium sp. 0TCS1.6C]MCX8294867.1 CBS domain-containing protein [Phyllobacterium sp. 0TCS1.6A]